MAEPPLKKAKIKAETDEFEILNTFRKDETKFKLLESAYLALVRGNPHYNLHVLKIACTDACSPTSFSQASCYCDDEASGTAAPYYQGNVLAIGNIFGIGHSVLKAYLDDKEPKVPRDVRCKMALKLLLEFLSRKDYADWVTPMDGYNGDECEWAFRVGRQLLSKLALDDNLNIDKFNYHNQKLKDDFKEFFGDTSFGVPDGWHGFVDILMQVPVSVNQSSQDTDEEDTDEMVAVKATAVKADAGLPVEIKLSKNLKPLDINQVLAQTIVFSFLQKKESHELANFLIPSLAISGEKMKVHFYDCVHDVLLESNQQPLFVIPGVVYIPTIVLLWLTLNYKLFCTGLPEKLKQRKSGFHELAKTHLHKYENDVQRPFRAGWSTLKHREAWTLMQGEVYEQTFDAPAFESLK